MQVPAFARLSPSFDAAPLLAEALALDATEWVAHFNSGYHDGGWYGAALRSPGGDAARLYSGGAPSAGFADTPLLARCPAIGAVLDHVRAPLRAVRLLRLAPGSVIREHRDDDLRFDEGHARLHVPIATGDAVEFYVDGTRVGMRAGECWYLDLSRPHRVQNLGVQDRIHLVIDCEVSEWLEREVAGAAPATGRPAGISGQESFVRFRERVHADAALTQRLLAVTQPDAFMSLAVELGRQNGFAFGVEDVRSAMAQGRRSWILQWII